jgi:hypothetical protein
MLYLLKFPITIDGGFVNAEILLFMVRSTALVILRYSYNYIMEGKKWSSIGIHEK